MISPRIVLLLDIFGAIIMLGQTVALVLLIRGIRELRTERSEQKARVKERLNT